LKDEAGHCVVVLGFQGNVSEHVDAVERALDHLGVEGCALASTDPGQIRNATALAIPGGESTTISRLIASRKLKPEIVSLARAGRPILGTCAGLILLAKSVNGINTGSNPGFASVMGVDVERNAFGRQRESFEAELQINIPGGPLRETGIFIRAPVIRKAYGGCTPVAWVDGSIVAALQGNVLGTCFHPELSDDSHLYEFLLAGPADEG
jgi:5'-phosphate synthase pdxT subunit